MPVLNDLHKPDVPEHNPSLSVFLAARNEQREVGEGVESMLDQDYPGELEVIAVNDRSTDRTSEILNELATKYPDKLRVLNVGTLPAGWLGT